MTKQPASPSDDDGILLPPWFPGPIALLAWVFLALALVKPLLPLNDQATGRHLTSGRIILEQHQIPKYDQLGFLYGNREYLDFEWLFNVASEAFLKTFGVDCLTFLAFILFTLTLCIMLRHLLGNGITLPVALAGVILLAAANYVHLLMRPIIFTYFFLTIVVALWTKVLLHRDEKSRWWLPVIFLFWSNIHPGFASGLLFMGLSLVGSLVDERGQNFARSRNAWLLLLLCTAVTLINPYGWNLHALIVHQVFHSKSLNQVDEFLPPDYLHPNGAVWALIVVLATLLVTVIWRKEKIRFREILPLLVFLFFAVRVQRHILLLLPVVLLPLCRVWDSWLLALFRDFWKERSARYTAIALHARREAFWVLAGIVVIGTLYHLAFKADVRIGANSFTLRAEQFVRENLGHFQRPFTSSVQAGNLLYYFHPRLRVSFDDRVDFYQDSDSFSHLSAVQAKDGWSNFLERHDFDSALLYPTDPLANTLSADSHWTRVFADPGLIIFQRTGKP